MRLVINGEERDVRGDAFTLAALLDVLGVEQRRGVAVAINDRVVPKSAWGDHALAPGDRVEIIRATQGG